MKKSKIIKPAWRELVFFNANANELNFAAKKDKGSRERRRTVQKNGLATLELKLLKGRNRIPNDLTILRGCPEGQP